MPTDGFAFAIRISREIDGIDAFAAACLSSAMSFFLPSMISYLGVNS